jgi:hypothetical protein
MAESEDTLEFDVYTPAIEVTHNRLKYTCDGGGLRKNGASFHPDVSEYLPILFKNGSINKARSQRREAQSADWWRAQCAFRGLPTSGSIGDVQARLRSGANTMIRELDELEKKAKAKWKAEDDANQRRARQEYQDQQCKDELNGVNHLKAIFTDNNVTRASIFKKDFQGLERAATKLGLQFRWIRAPTISLSFEWDDSWIIVGRTAADVEAKHAEVRSEDRDRILAQKMQKEEEQKAARDAETRLYASIADLSAAKGDWDVTGVWKITCPEFHDPNSLNNENMNFRIYRVSGTKISQMFAKFDFGIVKGWLRFEDPATQNIPAISVGQKRKRRAWDSFLIPLDTKPSLRYPTWSYRWRGRANGGEGYMEHGSDEFPCSITFSGKGGCALSGTFNSDFLECEFMGVKVGMVNPVEASEIAIDDQWGYLYDSDYLGPPK